MIDWKKTDGYNLLTRKKKIKKEGKGLGKKGSEFRKLRDERTSQCAYIHTSFILSIITLSLDVEPKWNIISNKYINKGKVVLNSF